VRSPAPLRHRHLDLLLVGDAVPETVVAESSCERGGVVYPLQRKTSTASQPAQQTRQQAQQRARQEQAEQQASTENPPPPQGIPMVTLNTTFGPITLELDAERAPKTVANFLAYARDGFYDGTIFHRVIDNFMIQGGGFDTDMQQKATGEPIENEADNGLTNDYGTVAMARTMDPHSATAQFFINVKDNDFLNHSGKTMQGWGYAVFGKVVGAPRYWKKSAPFRPHHAAATRMCPWRP
jgi:peptidyl-prolyl cis-trans isomerase B (cyclophilin B)